ATYNEEKKKKERSISEAFFSYLAGKGAFADWEQNKAAFKRVNGDNPVAMWTAFLDTPSTAELTDFAILLLSISVNQAGLERNFSDLKIKKTCLRNRLKLPRLEKMAKVGADIQASHHEAGLINEQKQRHNHDNVKVKDLLAVPRYADLLDCNDEGTGEDDRVPIMAQVLVKSRGGWCREMAKWVEKKQGEESDDEDLVDAMYGRQHLKWLPQSLDLLFSGRKETDIDQQICRMRQRAAHTEEAWLMELLADEEADEDRIPDDGELEGSSNDFEE
ncbi:hypothetical protein C0995_015230, partial [Termitomyces sp. Mi166